MFEIKYRIVDDFQQLKVITADDFNDERNQITGFFKFVLMNIKKAHIIMTIHWLMGRKEESY